MPTMKDAMFHTLVLIYDAVSRELRPDGSKMGENEKFSVYQQQTGYYFALMFTEDRPDNPYFRAPDALEKCVRAWDYFYENLSNEDGTVRIITQGDQFWGSQYEEWSTLSWLNTFERISPHLDGGRRARWGARVEKACLGLCAQIEKTFQSKAFLDELKRNSVANHFLWCVVCALKYGLLRGREDIARLCGRIMEKVARYQRPCGTWYEGGALVVSYAHVTFGALALYCAYSRNQNAPAVDALIKNARYLINCCYDDFSTIGCIDIRNRHARADGHPYIPASVLYDETARRFASTHIGLIAKNRGVAANHQGLAFFIENYEVMPGDVPMETGPLAAGDFEAPEEKLRVLRRPPWTVAYCVKPSFTLNSRWFLHRQNLLSVYHRDCGVIIGGGHSIGTPELSTFTALEGGQCRYLPDEGELTDAGFSVRCGEARGVTDIQIGEEVTITYRAENLSETGLMLARLPLWVQDIKEISVGGKGYPLDIENPIDIKTDGKQIRLGNAVLTLDMPARLHYPVFAFNCYSQAQTPDASRAFAYLECPLRAGANRVRVVVRADET